MKVCIESDAKNDMMFVSACAQETRINFSGKLSNPGEVCLHDHL